MMDEMNRKDNLTTDGDVEYIALGAIVLAMEEICENLKESAIIEDVTANADAMLKLATAYRKIKKR